MKITQLLLRFTLILALFTTYPTHAIAAEKNQPANQTEIWNDVYDAYVYTFPLVLIKITGELLQPANHLVHSEQLVNASVKSVVTLNVDTVYTQAFFDLTENAVILHKPASDRFFSLELLDAYTNSSAILGTGGDTQAARSYIITGPNFTGAIPKDLTQVAIPTNNAWLLARIIINDENDLVNVQAIQAAMQMYPFDPSAANYGNKTEAYTSKEASIPPINKIISMQAKDYFALANQLMLINPPTKDDAKIIQQMQHINVGPGLIFDDAILGENAAAKWQKMQVEMANKLLENSQQFMSSIGNWYYYGEPMARFGTEYAYRTLVAINGLGANPIELAIYPRAENASDGSPLNGNKAYKIHFKKDSLPPTLEYGFWSITVYGEDNFLIDNPINRYLINDRSPLHYNPDGSVDILLQTEPPKDETMLANWLPVKPEAYHLFMRIYLPTKDVLENKWQAPTIEPNL